MDRRVRWDARGVKSISDLFFMFSAIVEPVSFTSAVVAFKDVESDGGDVDDDDADGCCEVVDKGGKIAEETRFWRCSGR